MAYWGSTSGSDFPMFGMDPRVRIVPSTRLHVLSEECFFFLDKTVGPVTILSFLRRIFFKELVQCGPTASTVVWKSPWDPNSLDRATTCHRGRFLGRGGEGVQGLIRWFFVRFLYPNLTGRVKYCFKPPLVYWVIAGVKYTPRLGLYK